MKSRLLRKCRTRSHNFSLCVVALARIVTMENVITPEECERLIELGHVEGFKQSVIADGTFSGHAYSGRTSSNAWCQFKCYNDTLAQSALARVTEISMIPETNSEYWQLLHYKEGELYRNHHDYGEQHRIRQQGVRILTIYLYLNDVEEGGGTAFPSLNVTVMPKRGRALIWPSVLDENPNEMDPRTFHEAQAVIKGEKYGKLYWRRASGTVFANASSLIIGVSFVLKGANAWIHLRDFKGPLHNDCIHE